MFGLECLASIAYGCIGLLGLLLLLFISYKFIDALVRLPRIGDLESRYIFITGCDSGFGRDLTVKLDGLGCRVFAGCLTMEGEQGVKQACSDRVVTLPLNVADEKSVREAYRMVCEALPEGKGLWGVVNNAGISGDNGPVEWLTLGEYRRVLDVNLLGVIDVATVFLPLVKRARGRVVNMASVMGRIAFESMAPYCVSKYGVEAFSDAFRRQMTNFGVSVHLIEPGWFRTNITEVANILEITRRLYDRCSPEIQAEYGPGYVDQVNELSQKVVEPMRSSKTYLVVDAYVHALLGKYPRARYVCGADANYFLLPVQALPTYLGDAILRAPKERPIPQVCLDRHKTD